MKKIALALAAAISVSAHAASILDDPVSKYLNAGDVPSTATGLAMCSSALFLVANADTRDAEPAGGRQVLVQMSIDATKALFSLYPTAPQSYLDQWMQIQVEMTKGYQEMAKTPSGFEKLRSDAKACIALF